MIAVADARQIYRAVLLDHSCTAVQLYAKNSTVHIWVQAQYVHFVKLDSCCIQEL